MIHHHLTHTFHILKKRFVFVMFFFFFICGFFSAQYLASSNPQGMQTKEQCAAQIQQVRAASQGVSKEEVKLYVEKEKILQEVVDSPLYFVSSTKTISPSRFEVTFSLKGGTAMKTDAGDLTLSYSSNLDVVEIKTGETFPQYPRKVISDGEVIITGVASLAGSSVTLGKSNTVFATIVVEKNGFTNGKSTISLNKAKTQFYLQGKSVLNEQSSFADIQL